MSPPEIVIATPNESRDRRPWRPRCAATGNVCAFNSSGRCVSCSCSRHPAPAIGVPPEATQAERFAAF